MIEFVCSNCGRKVDAAGEHAGKRVRCPDCGQGMEVARRQQVSGEEKDEIIKFRCPHCNQKIGVPAQYAGRRVKCAKCREAIRVPGPASQPEEARPERIKFSCQHCGQRFGVHAKYAGKKVKCKRCGEEMVVPNSEQEAAEEASAAAAAGIGGMSDEDQWANELLAMEAAAPEVEDVLRTRPLEAAGVASHGGLEGAAALTSGFGNGAGGALHSSGGSLVPLGRVEKKRSGILIGAVCGLAALLMVILVWRFLVGFGDVIHQTGTSVPEARRFTEEYISLLEGGEIDKAIELLSPGLRSYVQKTHLESFAGLIGKSRIVDLRCMLTHIEEQPGGYECLLSYSLQYERDVQMVVASVVEADGDLRINGIAVEGSFAQSLSVGPRNYEEMMETMMVSVMERFRSLFSRYFCGFGIAWLVLVVIYIISMWVVFSKAGQPGWASIVPFYNMWVLAEVGGKPGWWGLVVCFVGIVPFVGWIISLVVAIMISIGVAEAFGRGVAFGLGLCFLGFIFYPILAFSSN